MQEKMEKEGWTTEEGWNNGLSGGDIAAVVLYFILVLGIGLYVSANMFLSRLVSIATILNIEPIQELLITIILNCSQ